MKSRWILLALLCVVLPVRAELSSEEWHRLQREAAELNAKEGEADRKGACIDALAAEDSARTVEVLVGMAVAAEDKRDTIEKHLIKAEAEYSKIHKRLRSRLGKKAPRSDFEKDPKWRRARDEVDELTNNLRVEELVIEWIGQTFAKMRSPEAIAVLVDTSNKDVARARESERVRNGILEALWNQPPDKVVDHVLAFASDENPPEARTRVMDWIAKNKIKQGYDVAVASLSAKATSVARGAVAALVALGDRKCVPELIAALGKAKGLLAEDIELALHDYTGQKFYGPGSATMYAGWWKTSGEAWLRSPPPVQQTGSDGHPEKDEAAKKGGAAFYGIATRSNRIVFVLDRSGSMNEPVPQPRGPVTGDHVKDRVPGKTRLEVAKNQLARTIHALQPDVKFAVIFYSHEVHAWHEPPELMPATATNKKKAIDWFMGLQPVGSTLLFEGLQTALKYAAPGQGDGKGATDPKGADTIYLLSDGAPSDASGSRLLTHPEVEKGLKDFLDANLSYRCVVNTIGVGPEHNRALMQRLAKETGGTYKAVGMR